MPPSPTLAAYWQHRGDLAMLQAGFWLLAMLVCWLLYQRFGRRPLEITLPASLEQSLPLRGRWLRAALIALLCTANVAFSLLALGGFAAGATQWREAARYRPR